MNQHNEDFLKLMAMKKEYRDFLLHVFESYDCDTGANDSHPSTCRVCLAEEQLTKWFDYEIPSWCK